METPTTIGRRCALAVLLVATVACAQKVHVVSDRVAPFPSYRTYVWTDGTPASDPLTEEKLHIAVDARLAGKGLATDAPGPDLIVATHVTAENRNDHVDRTLAVDVYDAKTMKMVWRGVATSTMSDERPKNDARMNRVLDRMFAKFPITAIPGR